MARLLALIFLALSFLTLSVYAQAAATCYMPDGSVATGVAPCNATAAVSACCDPRDSCSTSGICLGASGWTYRSSCTDSKWGEGCPQTCVNNVVTNKPYSAFTPIWPCAAGQPTDLWCCDVGSDSAACCAANFTIYTGIAFKTGTDAQQALISSELASATSGSHSATSTPSATAAASSQTSNTSNGSCSSGTNNGVAIGVGVGVPLGILAIGLLSYLIWREKRREKALANLAGGYDGGANGSTMHQSPMQQQYAAGGPMNQDAYGSGMATGVQSQHGQNWSQSSPPTTYGSPNSKGPNLYGGVPVMGAEGNIAQRHEVE